MEPMGTLLTFGSGLLFPLIVEIWDLVIGASFIFISFLSVSNFYTAHLHFTLSVLPPGKTPSLP